MSWRVRVAQVIARRSTRLANWWLRLTGSRLRIYNSLRVYVGGVEMRELRSIDFEDEKGKRRRYRGRSLGR